MIPSESWAAPPLPAGPRKALIIAIADYADPALRQLRSPTHDATAFQTVLEDQATGGFDVTLLANPAAGDIRGAIADFTADCTRDDLALVYLSCHGLLDRRRRLWFAAVDTVKAKMAATGVEATWLMDRMTDCRARQQVVVLDCCFSGAFARGAKGEDDAALEYQLKPSRGTVVLTASGATEYSFEGEHLADAPPQSVFTKALVDGLRTGAADTDHDGLISVDDAYAFAHDKVAGTGQTPQRWFYGAEGRIILARSPTGMRVTAAAISPDLKALLQHPFPSARAAAVETLGEWLAGDQPALILAARAELRRIADEDLPRVGNKARALLGEPIRAQLRADAEAEAARIVAAARESAGEIIQAAQQAAAEVRRDATKRLAAAGKEADALVAAAKREAESARTSPTNPRLLVTPAPAPELSSRSEPRKRLTKRATAAEPLTVSQRGSARSLDEIPPQFRLDGLALLWVGEPALADESYFKNWNARGAVVHRVNDLMEARRAVRKFPVHALVWSGSVPVWSRLEDFGRSEYRGRMVVFTPSEQPSMVENAKAGGPEGVVRNLGDLNRWLKDVADGLRPE